MLLHYFDAEDLELDFRAGQVGHSVANQERIQKVLVWGV